MADVGQEEVCHLAHHCSDLILSGFFGRREKGIEGRRQKVLLRGIKPMLCLAYLNAPQDLKREFITELIYPAVQANCIYEVSRVSNLNIAHTKTECVSSWDFSGASGHCSRNDRRRRKGRLRASYLLISSKHPLILALVSFHMVALGRVTTRSDLSWLSMVSNQTSRSSLHGESQVPSNPVKFLHPTLHPF